MADRSFDPHDKSIEELRAALSTGRVSAVDLVEACLARIEAYDSRGPRLNSLILLNPHVRRQASESDARRAQDQTRPLEGIPFVVKDNFATRDMPTSAGCIALASFRPRRTAAQLDRLSSAGALLIGKTNMHELAAGVTTIGSRAGATRNPYDPDLHPGGSSGGTAAAVTASFASFGMGTDTCGSIRIPAAHNNLFGLRPTPGISSTAGIVPLSRTQDTAGPLARTAEDLAIVLDATVDPRHAQFVSGLPEGRFEGLRIGKLFSYFGTSTHERAVSELVEDALDLMQELGAEIVEIDPFDPDGFRESDVIAYELADDLAEYLREEQAPIRSLEEIVHSGMHHDELARRLWSRSRKSRSHPVGSYSAAQAARHALKQRLHSLFESRQLDVLAYPSVRSSISSIGHPQPGLTCELASHSDSPAISIPAGLTSDALPAAIELLARPFDDPRLVALAHAFESVARPRCAPTTTPSLESGRAPRPVELEMDSVGAGTTRSPVEGVSFDRSRMLLQARLRASTEPVLVRLHRPRPDGSSEEMGPVVGQLDVSQPAIKLSACSVRDLEDKEMFVVGYETGSPRREIVRLRFPRSGSG